MKETQSRRGPNNKERNYPSRADAGYHKPQEKNGGKNLQPKEIGTKAFPDTVEINREANTVAKPPQVYENDAVAYMDEVYRSVEALHQTETMKMDVKESDEKLSDYSNWENDSREGVADESDPETINDSVSSHGDSLTADEEKVEKVSMVPKKIGTNASSDGYNTRASRARPVGSKASRDMPKKGVKLDSGPFISTAKSTPDNSKNMKIHPKPLLVTSVGAVDRPIEQEKKVDIQKETSHCASSSCNDVESLNTMEYDAQDIATLGQKIEEMETRVKKLEAELREVAALEISLYSVVPEHRSSAHKVHTPARLLSRLYIFACKYWSQDMRATLARNTVSGLVLVAKSCGNDVSRLTFWLSNIVVLREIISITFGSSCRSNALAKMFESNGQEKKSQLKAPFPKSGIMGSKQRNKQGLLLFVDDWQESRTLTAALEKVESWIFSRIVESIWWQTLTPNMQSPGADSTTSRTSERFLGPALGDQQQGNFSINLWINAFQDALKRLCPVRAEGHECGCLRVLARKVLEQCIGRLDVAMFNAILRESVHEIPTDPVSDPIVDSKVLPIPAGDLSFGSGAQLKNSVGNWARWLTELLGKDDDSSASDGKNTMAQMVCPHISLPLVKRVLCNFTPDELCPDPVPGVVLEALNTECIVEQGLSEGSSSSLPYTAAPVVYIPPSSFNVAKKIAEVGENSKLSRSSSSMQRKEYTNDEELDELESCLIDRLLSSPRNEDESQEEMVSDGANVRYDLLREVWLSTDS
ncbi:hypothetical protein F511_22207 [Dorcoceras hygrometricum]|uniref:Dilute domain-containing protein n=1 Tax=Dorcoceras hygrometricum TaxID=472368 RepID=A0A2Z7CGW6_9LAMI|nr:hypothetical protein F511_22207 [Dorcoceras hygrometricum]